MKSILVPIANGSEEIELSSIIDVLRRAEIDVTVASVMDSPEITAAHGLKITGDCQIDDCKGKSYDAIALPGGMPGAENLRDSETLAQLLESHHADGKVIAAICASPAVVLGHHGLLDGKSFACYPSFEERTSSGSHSTDRVVIDGNLITSKGPGTAIEFALAIVKTLCGAEKAKEVEDPLLIVREH